jgi:hypothetical protein
MNDYTDWMRRCLLLLLLTHVFVLNIGCTALAAGAAGGAVGAAVVHEADEDDEDDD